MNNTYIAHHGIKGQKWGVRRWQNEDGSLTPAGTKHYQSKAAELQKKLDSVNAKRTQQQRAQNETLKETEQKLNEATAERDKLQNKIEAFDSFSGNNKVIQMLTKNNPAYEEVFSEISEIGKKYVADLDLANKTITSLTSEMEASSRSFAKRDEQLSKLVSSLQRKLEATNNKLQVDNYFKKETALKEAQKKANA